MATEEARAAYEHGLYVLSVKVAQANWERNYYTPQPIDNHFLPYLEELTWRVIRDVIRATSDRHSYAIVRSQAPFLKRRKAYLLRINGESAGTFSSVAEAKRKAEIHHIQNTRR
jgi:hypothetical protein